MNGQHTATPYHHNHDINCDCHYCDHVRRCILSHDELVEALSQAVMVIDGVQMDYESKNGHISPELERLLAKMESVLAKAKGE